MYESKHSEHCSLKLAASECYAYAITFKVTLPASSWATLSMGSYVSHSHLARYSRHASWIIIVGSIIYFRVWQLQSSSACCWKVGALKPTSYLFIIYPSALTPAMCLWWYCSCNSHRDTKSISNYLEDELATFRSSRRERWTSVGMLCFSAKRNTALITMGRVSNSEVANYYN